MALFSRGTVSCVVPWPSLYRSPKLISWTRHLHAMHEPLRALPLGPNAALLSFSHKTTRSALGGDYGALSRQKVSLAKSFFHAFYSLRF